MSTWRLKLFMEITRFRRWGLLLLVLSKEQQGGCGECGAAGMCVPGEKAGGRWQRENSMNGSVES